MKKFLNNMILTTVLIAGIVAILTGCGASDNSHNVLNNDVGNFYRIEGSAIVYDGSTHVMYYKQNLGGGVSYMAPYYNEHGQLCRYVDGQIVPIE